MTDTTTTTTTVEIPADVRDNSETVTDYAFMGWLRPDKGVVTRKERDEAIMWSDRHGCVRYQDYDVNPNGQRCRFDILLNVAGVVRYIFHTEYYTRVACGKGDWCASYATHYTVVVTGEGDRSEAAPYCDRHIDEMRRHVADTLTLRLELSEGLLIGQHD